MSRRCQIVQQSFGSILPAFNSSSSTRITPFAGLQISISPIMNSIAVIVLVASLAACAADVSHLSLSRTYLPPLSGAGGYSYSSYPSYTGNAYSSGGYYSGSGVGLGSGYRAPLITSGYNNYASVPQYNSYASVPQYNSYATPSRAYLPAVTNYGGLDTKYAGNGGYIY